MKRDFDQKIVDLDGNEVRVGASVESMLAALTEVWPEIPDAIKLKINEAMNKSAGKPLTFGGACVGALLGAYEDERALDDLTRMSRMELARKIHKGGVQEIEPKDRDMIKPLLKKKYAGILVPVICAEMLEQEATTEGEPK